MFNQALIEAANGPLAGVLGINERPCQLILIKIRIHLLLISRKLVLGSRFVRILAWYDNEWGFQIVCLIPLWP